MARLPSQAMSRRIADIPDWIDSAACRGMPIEMFFDEDGNGEESLPGLEVCWGSCTVRQQCLCYAKRNKIRDGIFGGYSSRQRRRISVRSVDRNGSTFSRR